MIFIDDFEELFVIWLRVESFSLSLANIFYSTTISGHFRTCSEISSISATSENCDVGEVDRLLKKISELSEVLEVREMKVFELSRTNSELQEQNMDLSRLQLGSYEFIFLYYK